MHAQKSLDRFQFHYDFIGHDQVEAILSSCFVALINDRKFYLSNEGEMAQTKLVAHTLFIDRFQETWAKLLMNFDGGAYDLFGQGFGKKFN